MICAKCVHFHGDEKFPGSGWCEQPDNRALVFSGVYRVHNTSVCDRIELRVKPAAPSAPPAPTYPPMPGAEALEIVAELVRLHRLRERITQAEAEGRNFLVDPREHPKARSVTILADDCKRELRMVWARASALIDRAQQLPQQLPMATASTKVES